MDEKHDKFVHVNIYYERTRTFSALKKRHRNREILNFMCDYGRSSTRRSYLRNTYYLCIFLLGDMKSTLQTEKIFYRVKNKISSVECQMC